MTNTELRELDAKIETEIFGRCPHLHYQFTTGAFPRHDYICSECSQTFNAPHCPQYHRSWDAVFGLLVPEMERRKFELLYEGKTVVSDKCYASFVKPDTVRVEELHADGRIAILLSALAAVEMEKK